MKGIMEYTFIFGVSIFLGFLVFIIGLAVKDYPDMKFLTFGGINFLDIFSGIATFSLSSPVAFITTIFVVPIVTTLTYIAVRLFRGGG